MILTVKDALANGWRFGDLTTERGYVSRRNFDVEEANVYAAGGTRKGQIYALVPNRRSSSYCYRQYLVKN